MELKMELVEWSRIYEGETDRNDPGPGCTRGQIVVKGVMTAEDASEAVRQGVDAVWISNHGARQLDTTPATIEVLPEVCVSEGRRLHPRGIHC